MKPTIWELIKKFYYRKILKRKPGGTMPPKEFEMFKEQFLATRSRFHPAALFPEEEKEIDMQLRCLTAEKPTMDRIENFISVLASALETKKVESSERSAKWVELFKSGDLPTLIREFDSNFFGMMCAINDEYAGRLQSRLYYLAVEIADRLGGTGFILALNIALEDNVKTEKT